MTPWTITYFAFAIVAAVFGFGGVASASAGVAQILFYVFAALGVGSVFIRVIR